MKILVILLIVICSSSCYAQVNTLNLVILQESDSLYFAQTTIEEITEIYGDKKIVKEKGKMMESKYNLRGLLYEDKEIYFGFDRLVIDSKMWVLSNIYCYESCDIKNSYGLIVGMDSIQVDSLGLKESFGILNGEVLKLSSSILNKSIDLEYIIINDKKELESFNMMRPSTAINGSFFLSEL